MKKNMVGKKNPKRKKIKSLDQVKGYKSLKFHGEKFGVSKSTAYREVREQAIRTPGWEEITRAKNYTKSDAPKVASIDLTDIGNIEGKRRQLLVVTDIPSLDIVAHQVIDNGRTCTISETLQRLKKSGYVPDVTVTDEAKEPRAAAKENYPDAVPQLCTKHLKTLIRRAPELSTKRKRKDKYKKRTLREIKKQSIYAIAPRDKAQREKALEKLEELTKQGGRPKRFLERLKKKIVYCHCLDEPIFNVLGDAIRTTNHADGA